MRVQLWHSLIIVLNQWLGLGEMAVNCYKEKDEKLTAPFANSPEEKEAS
jgi:hypothetical protein